MITPSPGQELPSGKWCKKLISFDCSCGRTTQIPWRRYKQFAPKTCNECRYEKINNEDLLNKKFGKLKLIDIDGSYITKWNHKPVKFLCECGNIHIARFSHVYSGLQTSCGKCNIKTAEWWSVQVFGRLRLKNPINVTTGTEKIVEWKCLCGNEVELPIQSVTCGKTRSCGKCSERIKQWYIDNKQTIQKLKYPVQPVDIPKGGIELLEIATSSVIPVRTLCGICKSEYKPRFGGIKLGNSLTCGCSTNRISRGHLEVKNYIESIGFNVLNEHKLCNFHYDMFVPEVKCLIEFNGTKWHSSDKVKNRDHRKEKLAREHGYKILFIIDDEWNKNKKGEKEKIQNFLTSKVIDDI